jgi:hypothetical protein
MAMQEAWMDLCNGTVTAIYCGFFLWIPWFLKGLYLGRQKYSIPAGTKKALFDLQPKIENSMGFFNEYENLWSLIFLQGRNGKPQQRI